MKTRIARFISKYFLSEDIPLEARAFNFMAMIGILATSIAICLTCLFISPGTFEVIIYLSLNFFIITMLCVSKKCEKYSSGAALMFVVIVFVFTPMLYFHSGGISGGMTEYLIMIATFMFFMLPGRTCIMMSVLEIAVIALCFYGEYRYPSLVQNVLRDRMVILVDKAQAVFVVSVFIGVTIKFQAHLYAREREKAMAASRAKSEFLATMSHEIRTPLNAIIGLSEIQLQRELPAEMHSDMEKIYNSGVSLLGIINDILDISKIETGNLELIQGSYDTPSLINDVVQLNVVRKGTKPINFELYVDAGIPTTLLGDETRIRQILNNLLSNAFKYTEEGRVSLRVTWRPDKMGKAIITFIVSDTGDGIKKADMGKLFSKYTQLDTRANRRIEGTGLGLSITKKLLDMMDGAISVESVYHRGSTFTVKLPQTIIDGKPIGESVKDNLESLRYIYDKNRDRSRKIMRSYMPYGKVLVVDDVTTNLDVARGLLLPYGIKADCVHSGREAIDIIRSGPTRYDLILMDHMMPEMDGVEATRVIRNEIGTDYARTVPIVALTANAVAGNEEMFLANGFSAFISKPIDIMRLDYVLNQCVRDKQSAETLSSAELERPEDDIGSPEDAATLTRIPFDRIDANGGIRRYGSADTYIKVLSSYAKHAPEILAKMETVAPETLADYAVTIHGLKGASYGICADAIGNRAALLETAANEGDFETISNSNQVFIAAVRELLEYLKSITERGESGGERDMMPSPDPALLDAIMAAAEKFNTTAMDEAIEKLERYSYESEAELVAWLREKIDNLEYEAIVERLEKRK